MGKLLSFTVISASWILFKLYKRLRRISIAHVPGPEPESFLLGNYRELFQSQAGEAEWKWTAKYGNVVKLRSILGEDVLLLSDPKALQYIYQTSGYNFQKLPERVEISRLATGYGILWADGDIHKRHRKIMLPGFGFPVAKACIPIFQHDARKVSDRWLSMIAASLDDFPVIDIPPWLNRATLDSIGKTAFDYSFKTMDDDDSELAKIYMNVLFDALGKASTGQIFATNFARYLPAAFVSWMADHSSSPRLVRLRELGEVADSVARDLIKCKREAIADGKARKDILTMLVQANASENENTKMTEIELISQMRTILLAGHDTTANTLNWMLLELARHPDVQQKLRQEIHERQEIIEQRGETDFTAKDFDNMPYLDAFLRESLRMHPVASLMYRRPMRDEILPLSKPFLDTNGREITEIPVSKGQRIVISVQAYNRNKDIFGEDAHEFKPSRWLEQRVKATTPVGVIGNLMSFSSGSRACIGWRFAIVELQSFLVELVGKFEFAMTPDAEKVQRDNGGVMIPIIDGQERKGASVPLRVRAVSRSTATL